MIYFPVYNKHRIKMRWSLFIVFAILTPLFFSCAGKLPIPSSTEPLPPDPPLLSDIIIIPDIDPKSVCRRLENGGFNPGKYNEKDASRLKESIRRFQRFAKLEENGILNHTTWEKLQLLYDPLDAETPSSELPDEDHVVQGSPTDEDSSDYPVQIGDTVFAMEKIECSEISGDWAIFYEGIVVGKNDDTVSVRLEQRFAYRYRPNKKGIDDSNWYCIPVKRHCYSTVKFGDWGGTYSPEQVASFPVDQVYDAGTGIVKGVSTFIQQKCER